MLEIAVLGLLKEQPLHGYELKKRLSDTLGFLWGVSYGSLYPALRRLEREGAIEVVSEPVARVAPIAATGSLKGDLAAARRSAGRAVKQSRRTRKAYRITPTGDTRFVQLLLADDTQPDEDKAFALKFAFCSYLPAPARLELLERRRMTLLTRLSHARRVEGTRNDRYSRSLHEHRTRSTQRDLEWIDELIQGERAADGTAAPAVRAAEPGAPGSEVDQVVQDVQVQEGASR
jgi:DNA-binding PadR family transcriptional regulator